MSNLFDLFRPDGTAARQLAGQDLRALWARGQGAWDEAAAGGAGQAGFLAAALSRQGGRLLRDHAARLQNLSGAGQDLNQALWQAQGAGDLARDYGEYLCDAGQRALLAGDLLRARGDRFLAHEAAGCPPVLIYAHDLIMDGADLPDPVNYRLLRIRPPEGVTTHEWKRPYVIIDPRAGHGPGIGGFKPDSQVGVALRDGHPVYFVVFSRQPAPGQTLAHVTRAEAAFLREIARRHPASAAPVVTGNCQGGWATLLLAALNPDLTGPVVINGAPVATWSGRVGENPMRYNAGVLGGSWLAMLLSDLGGGLFDGAHLVGNFELLNPARTLFRKYTDLWRDAGQGGGGFLEFETWWGGFFLLNAPEIEWITTQLFIGNRLARNQAQLEPGRPVDLTAIRAPIIVFASHGDNITPPQQALNWITQSYADESEIRIRGQRIIYMVHDQVGHLGIFVSSKIARREHAEMGSTLKTIEALAPGLYEMRIEDITHHAGDKQFTVSFAERSFDDIRALDDGTEDERPFAAVARWSEAQARIYEATLRPAIRAAITPGLAEMGRALHPQRVSRALVSSRNPAMAPLSALAETVRAHRRPAAPENPFLAAEAFWVQAGEQAIDLWRDWRDLSYELSFFSLWASPWARAFGRGHDTKRPLANAEELRALPDVTQALAQIAEGGFAEAVIRMLILLADSRGQVRRDRLERSARVLAQDPPFAGLGAHERARIIRQQTLIASYEPARAIETLPALLPGHEDRRLALDVLRYIAGPTADMSAQSRAMIARFCDNLDVSLPEGDVTEDPLTAPPAG